MHGGYTGQVQVAQRSCTGLLVIDDDDFQAWPDLVIYADQQIADFIRSKAAGDHNQTHQGGIVRGAVDGYESASTGSFIVQTVEWKVCATGCVAGQVVMCVTQQAGGNFGQLPAVQGGGWLLIEAKQLPPAGQNLFAVGVAHA